MSKYGNPPSLDAGAPARAALAGNPSDGYGGRTLALALPSLEARVAVEPADGLRLGALELAGLAELDLAFEHGREPALMAAALRRLARFAQIPESGFALSYSSSVPGEVGLAGSSALVVAALRALCGAFAIELTPDELALTALEAETEELGIAAGPQDRVVQSYGGLVMMDFSNSNWEVEPLDPALLPPLFVAWRHEHATHSGDYHAELRRRHAEGDPAVHGCMKRLAQLATDARDALVAGDHAAFARCLDGSFDERAAMGPLVPEHVAMIELARSLGASANYAGSGGAIVGTAPSDQLRAGLERVGCSLLIVR
jgi:galactokinase/mevalonate kinase-like predicted kinase